MKETELLKRDNINTEDNNRPVCENSPKRRIMLTVSYDGTNYCGWQVQPNGISIQRTLQDAIEDLVGGKINLTGASRTDSGVHALGQVAVFDTTKMNIAPERFAQAVNHRLPRDIVVQESKEVALDFHPRYTNVIKTYEYRILNRQKQLPMERLYSYFVPGRLDVNAMKRCASLLIGTHDFRSFCSQKTDVIDTTRTITDCEIKKDGDVITLRISGNGFLYNMVRIIAGTLIKAGYGQRSEQDIIHALAHPGERVAGPTAPAHGLTLVSIKYI